MYLNKLRSINFLFLFNRTTAQILHFFFIVLKYRNCSLTCTLLPMFARYFLCFIFFCIGDCNCLRKLDRNIYNTIRQGSLNSLYCLLKFHYSADKFCVFIITHISLIKVWNSALPFGKQKFNRKWFKVFSF